MTTLTKSAAIKYWTYALWLAFFTIFYNLAEGLISIFFGLVASSLIYEVSGFGSVDSIGALGLIWFSYNEGKEAFEKAAGMEDCCNDEECEVSS